MLIGNFILWLAGSLVGLNQAANGRAGLINTFRAEIIKDLPVKTQAAGNPTPSQEVQYSLNVFRTGRPAAREAAVRRLEALGQVEIF